MLGFVFEWKRVGFFAASLQALNLRFNLGTTEEKYS